MNVVALPQPVMIKARDVPIPGEVYATCNQFLQALQNRGRAKNTLAAYETDLGQWLGFLQQRGIAYIQHATVALVEQFLDALIDGSNIKATTAARKRETLRSFFAFCISRDFIEKNPIDATMPFTVNAEHRIAPTREALLEMIEQIPTDTTIGLRDRAYFRLLFDAALRASAPCALDVFNDNQPPACTVLPQGIVIFKNKGGKTQSNPVDDTTMEYLNAWLHVRRRWAREDESALFVSRNGKRITRAAMHARVKELGSAAGMPQLHLHLFRHRRCGDIIETMGLREGADFLHHKNVNTTQQIYGHYGEAHRHARIRANCPLGTSSKKVSP
jgi:site-specific recombinase XerD